jgi:hypothetical protein
MSDSDATTEPEQVCSPYPPTDEAMRFDPSWRTSTVVSLATGIMQDGSFDVMPILADALQDAGCDNEILLEHCRHGTEHTTWCWVLELVTPPPAPEPPVIESLSGLPESDIEAMSRVSAPFSVFLETTRMWCEDDSTLRERTRKWLTILTYVLFFALVVLGSLAIDQILGDSWLYVASGCVICLGVPFLVIVPVVLAYFVCVVKALRNRWVRRRARRALEDPQD